MESWSPVLVHQLLQQVCHGHRRIYKQRFVVVPSPWVSAVVRLSVMITLNDLILCDLISKDHHVYFHFQSYYFQGVVSEVGCIYKTFCNGTQVFHERMPFDSLNDWADSCIQELCNLYVTRFSAWKRISHQESGLTLYTLRQLYNQFCNGKLPITQQTITTLRQHLSATLTHIETLEKQNKKLWQYINGMTSSIDCEAIPKSNALKSLTQMHNTYLMENN